MTHRVCIAGTAAVTALGNGVKPLFSGLMAHRSGIGRVNRFDTRGLAGSLAGTIGALDAAARGRRVRCLADMLLEQIGPVARDTRLIVAATKGEIEAVETCRTGQEALPEALLLSELTDYISRSLDVADPGININAACASSTIAIAKGAVLIRSGAADCVLVCCMDVVSRFVFTGFSALGAMSAGAARPFDRNRNGLNLGEGAAAILLMNDTRMRKAAHRVPAVLSGWGIAGDAGHLTAPDRDGSGLERAVLAACRMAGTAPADIHAVNTHGTGTVYNDAMELSVLNRLFRRGTVAANSIKGAIGHTLGAAGGIEAALCVEMLDKKVMVPTVGLQRPEKTAQGIVLTQAADLRGRKVLSLNSGFGGVNAALVIESVEA